MHFSSCLKEEKAALRLFFPSCFRSAQQERRQTRRASLVSLARPRAVAASRGTTAYRCPPAVFQSLPPPSRGGGSGYARHRVGELCPRGDSTAGVREKAEEPPGRPVPSQTSAPRPRAALLRGVSPASLRGSRQPSEGFSRATGPARPCPRADEDRNAAALRRVASPPGPSRFPRAGGAGGARGLPGGPALLT